MKLSKKKKTHFAKHKMVLVRLLLSKLATSICEPFCVPIKILNMKPEK